MEISKSSAHYKLIRKFTGGHVIPNNLCDYFLLFLGCVVANIVLWGGLTIVAIGMVVLPFWLFGLIPHELNESMLFSISCSLGMCAWAVLIMVALVNAVAKIQCWWITKKNTDKPNKPLSTFSLFTERIKSKKQKMCPVIDFVD